MPSLQIFNMANMSFNTIRENKIFTKISKFTVYLLNHGWESCVFVNHVWELCVFVNVDALFHSQHFFIHVGMISCLPGLNQH